jgi:hypothetical protein
VFRYHKSRADDQRRYSSFSAFKSSSGIDAALAPALTFLNLTPAPPPFSAMNSTRWRRSRNDPKKALAL